MVEIDGELSTVLEDRAVSPVIGVLLMVGIVVALAVVVFDVTDDLGESTGEVAPQAGFDYSWDAGDEELVIEHDGGETLNPGNVPQIEIVATQDFDSGSIDAGIDGTEINQQDVEGNSIDVEVDGSLSTGDEFGTLEFNDADVDSGDEIQVVWVTADGQTTQELSSFTIP